MPEQQNKSWFAFFLIANVAGVLSSILPALSTILTIVAAAALFALFLKTQVIYPIAALLLMFAVCAFLAGPLVALLQVLLIGTLVFTLGICVKRRRSFKRTMITAVVSVFAIILLLTAMQAQVLYGSALYSDIIRPLTDSIDEMTSQGIENGLFADEAAAKTYASSMKKVITESFIGILCLAAMLHAFFAYIIGKMMLARTGYDTRELDFLNTFRVSRTGGFFYIASFALIVTLTDATVRLALLNFAVYMMSPPFFLGGISVTNSYMDRMKIGRLAKIIIASACLLILPIISFSILTILLYFMVAVGVTDSFFDYRNRLAK